MNEDRVYQLDQDMLDKLRKIERELHKGTDRERDFAHRLWLALGEIESVNAPYGEQP